MAIVHLSRERKDAIIRNIRRMGETAMLQEISDYKLTSDVDASELFNTLHSWPYWEQVKQLPRDWLREVPETYRVIKVLPYMPKMVKQTYGSAREEHVYPLFQVEFPNSKHAVWKPAQQIYSHEARVTVEQLQEMVNHPEYSKLPGLLQLATNLTLLADVKAHEKKWADIESQLAKLFDQVKTVNAAVKQVPSIKFYLPDDVLKQLNTQVAKKERAVIDTSALDLDTITALGATAALTKEGQ